MRQSRRIRSRLIEAAAQNAEVRISPRARGHDTISGYVVAHGRKWVPLQRVRDGGYFDGYVAVRMSHIGGVHRGNGLSDGFARTRPEWPPTVPPGISPRLDSAEEMLRSLLIRDLLFGVEQSRRPGALWIGVPNELARQWLYMWEIAPDGSWHDQPRGYRVARISLIEFGSRYHRALSVVGGPPPQEASATWGHA